MNLASARALLAVIALVSSGCSFNRVTIADVPERTAPLKERLKAFKKLSIQSGQSTTYLKNGVPQGTSLDFVLLGDGTRVEDPRDLALAVEPTSPTGRYIAAVDESASSGAMWAKIFGFGGLGALALGLGVGLPLALQQSCMRISAPGYIYNGELKCMSDPATALPGALIAAIFGGIGYFALQLGLPLSAGKASGAGPDRNSAFLTYNESLKQRLGLDDESLDDEGLGKNQRAAPYSASLLPDALRLGKLLAPTAP
jgi:hypothetical protein